jgi:uncharacterized repeat protein (TIGR03803 family)
LVATCPAQTFNTLADLNGAAGFSPEATLVQGLDGKLYGTNALGGPGRCASGCGSVFNISPAGVLTTLRGFNGADASYPFGGLLLAADGNFYGVTQDGGDGAGYGAIFKITPGAR